MKLLLCADPHADYDIMIILADKVKKNKPDALLCAGDICDFGHGLEDTIKSFADMGIPIFIVQGNLPHETEQTIKMAIETYDNVTLIHNNPSIFQDVVFVGIGGGGFEVESEEFAQIHKELRKKKDIWKDKKLIFMSHAPPYNTECDDLYGEPVGNLNIRAFIEEFTPLYAVCGHIHENFHIKDKIKKTIVINPGDDGELLEF